MQCYTVEKGSLEPIPYIQLINGKIIVGEKGRGRKQIVLDPPQGSAIDGDALIGAASRNSPPDSVLVLIRDQSGYRGSWSLKNQKGMRIIAEGWCAQGDAGRMGGGPEYLATLDNGGSAEIHRSGRLYGEPAVIRLLNSNAQLIITDTEQEAANVEAQARLEQL